MSLDAGRVFAAAWRVAPKVPEPLVQAVLAGAADVSWARHGHGVRQLEANLRRVRPDATRRELRRLSRTGMRSYMRYYAQTLMLGTLDPEQVDARVHVSNDGWIRELLAQGGSVVVALGHTGNWDLAGAWAARHLPPVVTVAERLEPESLFQEFLALREGLGMRIVPLAKGGGGGVFRSLVEVVRNGPVLLPLLADRDLTSHGVEVELFGEPARVAAGPAALAASGAAVLTTAAISYVRLTGARRRAAGTRWLLDVRFSGPVEADPTLVGRARVQGLTQAWVDQVAAGIAQNPQDWHMLQKVFVADLDTNRLAAVPGASG